MAVYFIHVDEDVDVDTKKVDVYGCTIIIGMGQAFVA